MDAVTHFTALAAQAAKRVTPDAPRSAKFFAEAYQAYLEDAKNQEALEVSRSLSDVFEMRLIGSSADEGTMQLQKVLKLLDPMNRGIHLAAHRLRYGSEAIAGRVHSDVYGTLDLRLGGVEPGSTRLMLLGRSQADTTGVSLLPATMHQLFRILDADEVDFYDAVHAVGSQAASKFSEALKAVRNQELATEITWHRDEESYSWGGDSTHLAKTISMLDAIGHPETFEQTLTGVVEVLRARGYFTLETGNVKQKVRFSAKQLPEIQQLVVGRPCQVVVETTKFYDQLAERDIERHRLTRLMS